MENYELTIVAKPGHLHQVQGLVVDTLRSLEIVEFEQEIDGEKHLAYPIKGYSEGVYIRYRIGARNGVGALVEKLTHSELILRTLCVLDKGKFYIQYSPYMLRAIDRVAEGEGVNPEKLRQTYEEKLLDNFEMDLWDIADLNREELKCVKKSDY